MNSTQILLHNPLSISGRSEELFGDRDIILSANNISFSINGTQILKNINFSAGKGEIISLLGPNGSGKSTLLKSLSGINNIKNGDIVITGDSIKRLKNNDIAQRIAFLPQFQEKIMGITVEELVGMGRTPYHRSGWVQSSSDKEKINRAIEYMKISHLRKRSTNTLSGGERQRVWIAMVIAQDTPIILLDEPVTYMDLKHQWDLLGIIKDLKDKFQKTIITVFHDINHALEISDYIYLLHEGKVHSTGKTTQIITRENIREVFGVSTHICHMKKHCKRIIYPISIKH